MKALVPAQPQYGPSLDEALHLRLFQAHHVTIDPQWRTANVHSSFWRLYLNERDGASVRFGDHLLNLKAHRVYLLPAWLTFDCQCVHALRHLYVHFDILGFSADRVRTSFPGPMDLGPWRALSLEFGRLRRELGSTTDLPPTTLCRVKAVVFAALARALEPMSGIEQKHLLALLDPSHRLQPALEHIQRHLHLTIRNHDLAKACHLSESQLTRYFRALMGQTPNQYVLDQRIARAAQALAFSDDTIDEIADRHGFPDRYYFSRVFHARMGLPPAAYRRRKVI